MRFFKQKFAIDANTNMSSIDVLKMIMAGDICKEAPMHTHASTSK